MSADTNDVPRRLYTGTRATNFNVLRSKHPAQLARATASRHCPTGVAEALLPPRRQIVRFRLYEPIVFKISHRRGSSGRLWVRDLNGLGLDRISRRSRLKRGGTSIRKAGGFRSMPVGKSAFPAYARGKEFLAESPPTSQSVSQR